MAGEGGNKKKVTIAALASILLVAAVVGTVVGVTRKNGGDGGITASTKAVSAICAPTDFKETCEKHLAGANTEDPKELVKFSFNEAIKNITDVIKSSKLIKEAAKDESTKGALDVCEEVLGRSIDDLKRSVDKVGELNINKVDSYIDDIVTWLTATRTYQETCVDAFENTTGDTGEKMKALLRTARELTVNGLAIIQEFKSILPALQLGGISGSRRLFQDSDYEPGFHHYSENGRRYLGERSSDLEAILTPEKRRLLAATPATLKPQFVVAQDGSTPYKTLQSAVNALPKQNPNNETIVILVKAGVYKENVIFPKLHHVMLIGEGPEKTKITDDLSFAGGVKTYHTATIGINGEDFICKDITIENSAGYEGHQAVAVRVTADKTVFHNVVMDGYQDTLYTHTYRQYYRDCTISGTIDFIFGDALALFQNCKFLVRKPGANQKCMVTAQGRQEKRQNSGIIIQNGTIVGEPALLASQPPVMVYLGRPWKNFSRTIIMESYIDGIVQPEGWSPWEGTLFLDTLWYAEYKNRGPGADLSKRVNWEGYQKNVSPKLAEEFGGRQLYLGEGTDEWITKTGVPYVPTLMNL